MDLDQGGRQLAGLILDAAGRGEHDQVADLIAPLDTEQRRSLVTAPACQVAQSAPASSAIGPAAVCELAINAAAPMFGDPGGDPQRRAQTDPPRVIAPTLPRT